MDLSTLSTDTASQLDVFWHDGDTLGVDGAEVSVLKQTNQISLAGLLKGHDGRALESQIGLEILSDLTDQTLEGELADQKLGGLLVSPDLTESHGTRSVPVRLLHTPGGRGGLASSLGSKLLPGSLTSSGFTCGLLGTSHGNSSVLVMLSARCSTSYIHCAAEKMRRWSRVCGRSPNRRRESLLHSPANSDTIVICLKFFSKNFPPVITYTNISLHTILTLGKTEKYSVEYLR